MKSLAEMAYKKHKAAFEKWPYGSIKRTWMEDDTLYIEYQDGTWFHYKDIEKNISWW